VIHRRENGAKIHQHRPYVRREAGHARSGIFIIDHENADQQQAARARHDMREDFPRRLTRPQPPAERGRYRHSHDKKKRRKNQIDKRHPAAPVEVTHPIRHNLVGHPGNIIDKDHGEHDQSPRRVDRGDARQTLAHVRAHGL
jgi:hypothetical protein